MPTYTFECTECKTGEFVRITRIDTRDSQTCEKGHKVKRKIDRPASVWAPTSTGGGHK